VSLPLTPSGGTPSLRRGALAATAIAISIGALTACGAGNDAQTLQVKPDNAATTVGDIKVQNATIITQPDLQSTGPAVVTGTLFNNGTTAQTLESIRVAGTNKRAQIKPAKGSGPLTIPAGGSVILGGKGNASAVLPSSREAVQDGNAQQVTFTFSKTGDVKLRAFVVPAEHFFTKWGPTELPKPAASASRSASPAARASASVAASGEAVTGEAGTGEARAGEAGTGTSHSSGH
jgi:copper(I)-binding protein